MLHLLPDIERIAESEPNTPQALGELGSAGARLQKHIREDVARIIHQECLALHMKLEERMYLMENNQRATLQTFLGFLKSSPDAVHSGGEAQTWSKREASREASRAQSDDGLSQCSTTRSGRAGESMPKRQETREGLMGILQHVTTSALPNLLHQASLPAGSPQIPDVQEEPMGEPPHKGGFSDTVLTKTMEADNFRLKAERMAERAAERGNELAEASGWGKKIDDDTEKETLFQKGVDCCHFGRREQLLSFVKGRYFEFTSSVVIATNAIFMGVKANIELDAAKNDEFASNLWVLAACEKFFTLFFAVEWLMRFMVYQKWFFRVEDWKWHVFDTLLVGTSVIELILEAASLSIAAGMDAIIVRLFRMIRLVRLLKIVRYITAFRELRLMINGLFSSIRSLFWSFVLLGGLIYVFSICFSQAAIYFLQKDNFAAEPAEVRDDFKEWFGSTQVSMRTLLVSISGGADWVQFVLMLQTVDNLYSLIFIFYIMLVFHGVLHVIASIFVDSAMATSQTEKDQLIRGEMQQKDSYMKLIRGVLLEADHDQSGTISWLEFQRYLEDPRVKEFFKTIELDVTEARGLFKLLDVDESDEVPIDEFVTGCFRLKGGSKSLDLASLMHENKKQMRVYMKFMSYTQQQFEALFMKLNEEFSNIPHS